MPRPSLVSLAAAAAACLAAAVPAQAQHPPSTAPSRDAVSTPSQPGRTSPPFHVVWTREATIADIRGALEARTLTCRQLVQGYIDRIEAYDRKGPALNAIVMVNPGALATATRSMRNSAGPAARGRCIACR
jgi:hypothetical protein